jgi:hypothetical protein
VNEQTANEVKTIDNGHPPDQRDVSD